MNKTISYISLSVFVVLSFLFLGQKLDRPFQGHHEFNGVFYSQIARNYLRLGLGQTRLAQVVSPGDVGPSLWGLHTHHPPTYPLLLASAFALFGESEMVARALSLTSFIAGLALITRAFKSQATNTFLFYGLLPLLAMPLVRYYASVPVFEPLLFFFTCGLIFSIQYHQRIITFLWAVSLVILDWPGFWPVVVFLVGSWFIKEWRSVRSPLILALITGVGVILLAQWFATGHPYNDLISVGAYRFQASPYTPIEWLHLLVSRLKAFVGWPILLISLFPVFLPSTTPQQKKLLISCLVFGFLHIIIFRNITWYHDYMLFHLLPFFALALLSIFHTLTTRFGRMYSFIGIMVVAVITYQSTAAFTQALFSLKPHQDCVDIGIKAKAQQFLQPIPVSTEKQTECAPFIIYYADKTAPLVATE